MSVFEEAAKPITTEETITEEEVIVEKANKPSSNEKETKTKRKFGSGVLGSIQNAVNGFFSVGCAVLFVITVFTFITNKTGAWTIDLPPIDLSYKASFVIFTGLFLCCAIATKKDK